ncbi:hypothetical protein LSTR_LSTR006114 [Laodelphax striatellus]|uniref:Uncharacterized protein n=1 Tax=Laodelphax striatellus TaxID=195883 RepID=A0A482WY74_LAOST|nr:hypothetical protein LSTR_LSTR006114 [Laodelphax striatellus]
MGCSIPLTLFFFVEKRILETKVGQRRQRWGKSSTFLGNDDGHKEFLKAIYSGVKSKNPATCATAYNKCIYSYEQLVQFMRSF